MVAALILVLIALSVHAEPAPPDSSIPTSVRLALPSVVRIHVVESDYADGREVKQEVFGSGVIISRDGLVVTNHHVAGRGKYFTCTLTSREELAAVLVGSDALTDIAVLKLAPRPGGYVFARFGDSSQIKVGQRVYALGSPITFDQSVTSGIISNAALSLPEAFSEDIFLLDGEDVGSAIQWIGHDAPIYPGNSGGPLLNARGEILGINEIKMALSGAIPANLAHDVAVQLINLGVVRRSWLGLSIQPLLKSSRVRHGALINGTLPGSPAQHAGFQAGDVLLRLNGNAIDVHYREDLPPFNLLVMSLPIGKSVGAVILRNGKEMRLFVTPAQRPSMKQRPQEFGVWGMCACDNHASAMKKAGTKSNGGVEVISTRPGGAVDNAKPAIDTSDIIVEIDGQPVKDTRALHEITKRLMQGQTDPISVLVVFERHEERYRTVVKLGAETAQDTGREVRKAWLPVSTQVLNEDLADKLKLPGQTGVCITRVYPNSSAEKAGLQVGDLIIALDGQTIAASRPEDTEVFPEMVRAYDIGSKVELSILRDGKPLKVAVELSVTPLSPGEMKRYRNEVYEFSTREVAFKDRLDNKWDAGQRGVLVDAVSEGGWAALGHLKAGDLMLTIDGKSVVDVEGLSTMMKRIAEKKPEYVVVGVQRESRNLFLEWHANWALQP